MILHFDLVIFGHLLRFSINKIVEEPTFDEGIFGTGDPDDDEDTLAAYTAMPTMLPFDEDDD